MTNKSHNENRELKRNTKDNKKQKQIKTIKNRQFILFEVFFAFLFGQK